jgi:pimeloyl-ACP methyl ester carboxylesterase
LASASVLLLHGQPGSARDWAPVTALLDGRARAIAIDRPGWDGLSLPADLTGNARAATGALDSAGIERATIVGHSFGAAVATRLAILHPERVEALVLIAPSANCDSLYPVDYLLAGRVVGYLAAVGALAAVGLALTAAPLRRRMAGLLSLDERYLRSTGRALLSPATWRAFASDQRALVSELPALEARLGEISAPTTIVASNTDRVVPIAAARRLATQIPNAELVVLERTGHLLPQQSADGLAELISAASLGR